MDRRSLQSIWRILLIAFLIPQPALAENNSVAVNGTTIPMAKSLRAPIPPHASSRYLIQFKRPLSKQERDALQLQGIRFEHYVRDNLYLACGSGEAIVGLAAHNAVSGVSSYPAEAKIDAAIRADLRQSSSNASLQPMSLEFMTVKILFHESTPFDVAKRILELHGALLDESQTGFDYRQTIDRVAIPPDRILPLAKDDGVFLISEIDTPLIPCNVNAQDTSNIDEIHPGGVSGYDLDGGGVAVGVWDPAGALTTHSQLEGRARQIDGSKSSSYHATHVAGTIAASGVGYPNAQGMAPNASVLCWNSYNDLSEMDSNAHRIAASNHSYTAAVGWEYDAQSQQWHWYGNTNLSVYESHLFGRYNTRSYAMDQIVYDHDLTVVVAAGNNRSDPNPIWGTSYTLNGGPVKSSAPMAEDGEADHGFDTLNTIGVGKNVITVGAVHDRLIEPPTPELASIAPWSSWGPADDGRIKPDIVANGVKVLSLSNNSKYATKPSSGTSMSAPVVTGAIACLVQQFQQKFNGAQPSSAAMKNIILHTAQDEGTPPGPDYRIGWGLLDARAAADFIAQIGGEGAALEINSYEGSPIDIPAEYIGEGPIKATMVWTDPPAMPALGGLDDDAPVLVNDLDLSISGPDDLHYPWTLDHADPGAPAAQDGENHRDNIEQVFIADPADGPYTIRIGGRVNWGAAQNFVLCISGLRLLERETKLLILQPSARRRTVGVNPIHIFASSESGVASLRVELDGLVLDDPATPLADGFVEYATPPLMVNHRFNWDTTSLANGEHVLTASIQDASGQILNKSMSLFILNDQDYMPLTAGGDSVMQELSTTNDRDWFVIRPPESGYYTIETHALGDYQAPDTELILYGPNNQNSVLIENDDGGIDTLSKIVCFLERDQTYYVRVSKYLGGIYSKDDGLYAIDCRSASPEQAQPAVAPIPVNGPPVSGEIVDIGEEHWLQFDAQVLATYIIEASPPEENAAGRFQFDLYNPGSLTLPIDSGDFQKPVFRVFGKDNSYLLKISSPKTTGRYAVSVQTLSEISTYYLEINSPPKSGSFQSSGMEEAWYIFEAHEFTTYFMELFTESPDIAASTYFILYGPDDPAREYVRSQMQGADYARIFMPLRGGHIYFLQILKKSGVGEYAVQVKTPGEDLPFTPSGSPPTILNNKNRVTVKPLSDVFFESAVPNWFIYP